MSFAGPPLQTTSRCQAHYQKPHAILTCAPATLGTATDNGNGFHTAPSSRRPHNSPTAPSVAFLVELSRRLGNGTEAGVGGAKRRAQSDWRPNESQQRAEAASEAGEGEEAR